MKYLLIVSLLWVAPVMLEEVSGYSFGTRAEAAEKKVKKRRVPPLKERIYKILAEATMLIDPDSVPIDEGEERPDVEADPQAGVALLLKSLKRRGLNAYEIAQIWNTLAFAYYTLDDVDATIVAYENVLKQPQEKISLAIELSATRALFQLHYSQASYRKAIEYIDKWQLINARPDAGIVYIKSTAYYQLDDFHKSLEEALHIEEIVISQEKKMKEQWLYIQVILYNELEDIDNQIRILERMVVEFSKKQYWMHLAGMYAEKEWDDQALSTYYAAYIQGYFAKEIEVVMLSQRLLNAEVPWEAAKVLEQGFDEGVIEKNERNIRILASAYTMAQEYSKAIVSWQEATEYAEDGEIHYRLAQALANEDRHKEAVSSYQDALDAGDLNESRDVSFWMGISLMQEKQWNGATRAFREAAKDKRKAKSARQYIRYIQSERKRLAALREMAAAA